MKETWYKIFGIIKNKFIVLLTRIVHASSHTKCASINNQCETQPTLINLHPMNTVMNYTTIHPFAVKLGSCIGSCNTLNDLSNKLRVPHKTEDLNIK